MFAIKRGLTSSIVVKELRCTATTLRSCSNNSISNTWASPRNVKFRASKFAGIGTRACSRMSATTAMEDRLIWIDMEMTGLDENKCHILEIACLITNLDLDIVSEDFNIVVHQPDNILNSMNSWCTEHHGKTGLTDASRASKISLIEAEDLVLTFLATYVPKRKCPIAGNSVWVDRIFLKKYMPNVDDYAHYRIVDVSTVKELSRRWCPQKYIGAPDKKLNHRALDDIKESINELKYYKSKIFDG